MATGDCLHTLRNHNKDRRRPILSKASTGGQWLAYSFDWKTIGLWNTVNGIESLPLEHRANDPISILLLTFSADDRLLASASVEALKIWDVETGNCVQTIATHTNHQDFHLSFDTNYRTRLHTRFGFLDLDLLPERTTQREGATNEVCYRGYGIDDGRQESWILQNGKRVLRLPPDHVPHHGAFTSFRNGTLFFWVSSSGKLFRLRVSSREYYV